MWTNHKLPLGLSKVERLTLAGVLAAVVATGVLLAWRAVSQMDCELRADLLRQATLVAQAVDVDRLKALSGNEADMENPVYRRLKAQLMAVRSANPSCRFLYLTRRGGDGSISIIVDSEPPGSQDCSPPGQVYVEASAGHRSVFSAHAAMVDGPYTDRWGTWISAFVPIQDPHTASVGLATMADAREMVRKAVEFHRKRGRARLLEEINNPRGEFNKGDLYAFAYDHGMTMLSHPVKPWLVGQNQLDKKDWSGGKCFRKEIQAVALSKGRGWVDYEYENPASGRREPKSTYVERVDDLIVCAGAYKGTGAVIAALGVDVASGAWRGEIAWAALPPALLTLALVSILLAGSALLARRSRLARSLGAKPRPAWMLEPALAAATGLSLTGFAVWMAHMAESRGRAESFTQLAASQTEAVATTLRSLRSVELEGLARFCENSPAVSPKDFRSFTAYLARNPAVQAWGWAPAVLAADKARFEELARTAGQLDGFEIWRQGRQEGREAPASSGLLHPVFLVAPLAGNEGTVGYDLGSEPLRPPRPRRGGAHRLGHSDRSGLAGSGRRRPKRDAGLPPCFRRRLPPAPPRLRPSSVAHGDIDAERHPRRPGAPGALAPARRRPPPKPSPLVGTPTASRRRSSP